MEVNELIQNSSELVPTMKLLASLTFLMFLPSLVFMMTSFVRIIVTFSFAKSAVGVSQNIPNQILIGLAIFMTIFIMSPVAQEINENALKPYLAEEITTDEALEIAQKPIKEFLLNQTLEKDLELFVSTSNIETEDLTKENLPLSVIVPAFAISELKTGFQIGFIIYLPFVVIDLFIASCLTAMGMFMVPPAMIATPVKLLLFILIDGWNLISQSLIMSFR
jgi:flagellar biosynthetic protein FliP